MKFKYLYLIFLFFSCETVNENKKTDLIYPDEKHFKSIRQITFGGDNAEAYWSFDDQNLVFQSNNEKWNVGCDQMFLMTPLRTWYSMRLLFYHLFLGDHIDHHEAS